MVSEIPAAVTVVEEATSTLLRGLYRAFNAREIDTVLAALHPQVDWANGMEGGHVHGHEAIRAYWTRQWEVIDPKVEPQGFRAEDTGDVVVTVHQVVHDRAGALLGDQMVEHVYRFGADGLITRMDIRTV